MTTNRTKFAQAIAWMGLALLSFSAIAIAGREGGRQLTTNELIFWRSLIGIAIIGGFYLTQPGGLRGAATNLPQLHAARSSIHYAAQFAWLYAVTLIPLAELFALEFTAPLWVALLAPIFLAERLTPWRIAAAILGFVGALIVAEPGLLLGRLTLTASSGTIAAALSAIGFASAMLLTKRLTRQDSALKILFWMQVLQAIFAALIMTTIGLHSGQWPRSWATSVALSTWGWVFALGVAGLTAHYGLTRAFALADAIVVAPMDFLRLPLIAVAGALFYGEQLSWGAALGAAIVVIANGINMWAERRQQRSGTAKIKT